MEGGGGQVSNGTVLLRHDNYGCHWSQLKSFALEHDDRTSGVFGTRISLGHRTMVGKGFGHQMC